MTFDVIRYWEERYKKNGNSGAGSYKRLGMFKVEIINKFLEEHNIDSVVEFGCGDGNLLDKIQYKNYTGYDVSKKSIEICKEKFKEYNSKKFLHVLEYQNEKFDLSLSLDVIYHLVEENLYIDYIDKLFNSSKKFVIIYSSNDPSIKTKNTHVKHRMFTNDVPKNFICKDIVKNPYVYNELNKKGTSFSDFYIFEKQSKS